MTTWIQLSDALAERIDMPAVPLPVRDTTIAALADDGGRLVPALIALDVAEWLAAGHGSAAQRKILSRYVAVLAYTAGTELLDRGRPDAAANVLDVGVDHASDDPSIRALLGVARWDAGHPADALGHLTFAVDQYAAAGQVAPLLTCVTARILVAAGRHDDALEILRPLIATDPDNALFWDLVDAAGAEGVDPPISQRPR